MEKEQLGEPLDGPVFVILPETMRSGIVAGGKFYPVDEPPEEDGVVADGWRVRNGSAYQMWRNA